MIKPTMFLVRWRYSTIEKVTRCTGWYTSIAEFWSYQPLPLPPTPAPPTLSPAHPMQPRPHLLQGCFGTEGGKVGAHKAVALLGHLLQVYVVRQLHVLGVDTQDLQTTWRGAWQLILTLRLCVSQCCDIYIYIKTVYFILTPNVNITQILGDAAVKGTN